MRLIGADVGGTFTDIVLADTAAGTALTHKVASTPVDPSLGVLRGISEMCERASIDIAQVEHLYHGTTVATNAALQYRGALAGMVTTKGFRDVIHIGRHQRPQHYSIQQDIPWQSRPLVKRRHRKVVAERLIPPDGRIDLPLDEDEVRAVVLKLRDAGVASVAVCFLFSYLNPEHERRAKEVIEALCPDIFVTCSHEVSPQFREFERFTTTAMNAFVGPLVRDYVQRLEDGLTKLGFSGELHIMRSNGGVAPVKTITRLPVHTLMSGLAAGVLGGAWIGEITGRRNVISLDIGGTSADIGVVTDGRFAEASARDTFVAGYPILVPMIDLHTIGAGGGSIAYVDEGGAFRVGPESAGAEPGPAAYAKGGTRPTVTDANIILGRLDTENFLGGAMTLDAGAAERAMKELADTLKLPLLEAAEGVVAVLNANMANAIRARTVQKGIDPREYALVAAGGAGPLHAAEVAMLLEIPEVVVPPHPGINSAKGLLTTDLKYDIVRTAFLLSNAMDLTRLNQELGEMEAQLRGQLQTDHIDPDRASFERSADARYVGQGYELRLPLLDAEITPQALEHALNAFHELHRREYGHHFSESVIEFVNLRVTAIGEVPKIGPPPAVPSGSLQESRVRTDRTVFRVAGELHALDTAIYTRDALPAHQELAGPAIILQTDSTTVVPPGCAAVVDETGSLFIRLPGNVGS